MPRGQITKDHFKILILQQKNKLDKESYVADSHKTFAHKHFNELLDRIEEFRY